ncbi:vWA domain-containing protein [Geomonas azotofigens]|uniref:vWA domain-containing protein n=1 Tax=Geomonas azotofigens TaxID=2843196 RepID=UPI001C11C04E|nr:vWA domain-containing protein [Geomonas azotofigens]MBU5614645.1 VWA domain-containing protein [Geomonas azotofigens]
MRCRLRGGSGQVLVGFAAAAVFLLAMIGLAIDLGMAYLVKTKLSAAVDAAALAAGRAVAQGESAATAEAVKFFAVNYPDGLLGASVAAPSTTLRYDNSEKSWEVTVSTTAVAPAYFAKVLGRNSFTVGATGTSTIASLDLVLVLDSTHSLMPPTSPAETPGLLKSAAKTFVSKFDERNDRIGLIHFAMGAEEDASINARRGFNKTNVADAIEAITFGGYTNVEEALRLAKHQLDAVPPAQQSRLRIIVLFSDGAPNGVAGDFKSSVGTVRGSLSSQGLGELYAINRRNSFLGSYDIAYLPDGDFSGTVSFHSPRGRRGFDPPGAPQIPHTLCNLNRAARNAAENIANAARSESGAVGRPIVIYTIGLGARLAELEVDCGYGNDELGLNLMKRVANVKGVDTYQPDQPAGIFAYAANANELDAAFDTIYRDILRLTK